MTIGNSTVPYRIFAKLFARWDSTAKLLRLGRVVWSRHSGPGNGKGWSAKFSWSLSPLLFHWSTGDHRPDEWKLVLCGVRFHYSRSWGGWIQ